MKKILLVDNIRAIVEKEKNILSRSDFSVFTATSGEEAMRIHGTENVDLIITDLDMPRMSGDVLCTRIRRSDKLRNVSIIIVCSGSEADMRRFRACGANAYITKPISLQQLFQKVSDLLNIPLRLSIRLLVKVTLKGKYRGNSFFAESHNISSTGVLIQTDKVLQRGDLISCSFFLGTSQIASDGEIVRVVEKSSNLYQYGVKFTGMDSDSGARIDEFVLKLLKR
jgi:CheY-like chemotaxis protein